MRTRKEIESLVKVQTAISADIYQEVMIDLLLDIRDLLTKPEVGVTYPVPTTQHNNTGSCVPPCTSNSGTPGVGSNFGPV